MLNQKKSKKFRKGKKSLKNKSCTLAPPEPIKITNDKIKSEDISKDQPIDYSVEVGEILKIADCQDQISSKRSSELTKIFTDQVKPAHDREESSVDNQSTWLDELWKEDFNIENYVGISPEFVTIASPFENPGNVNIYNDDSRVSEALTKNIKDSKEVQYWNFFNPDHL